MTVTGGIVHGWCTAIFIAQATLSHGSNAYKEVLRQLLNEVSRLCKAQGRRYPHHLVLQADNYVANQLVGMAKFITVTMHCLMAGHTHEDVDQR